ncbi:methylmalonyl-CoA epimerase, mitochondrial isoform X2 [Ornithorhynchus anatinus]|uniref:methylmalonyl-CoA epimerase, mitochondrial isoform X2 n=1 Tax=Ornithorhynchus anatinus TaxID=9258 RepID=UPI0010A94C48|nr:methylmalonyl-CoA epimerase, mitochondrial isoform X2 [Ornithorhynchus anatinus]
MAYVRKAVAAAVRAVMAATAGFFRKGRTPGARASAGSAGSRPSTPNVPGALWTLGRLNHVAVAVPDLERARSFYGDTLGARVGEAAPLPEHGVSVVFVELGNTKLELLHPLGEDSPIAGFLQKNKVGGMHHICIEQKDPRGQRNRDLTLYVAKKEQILVEVGFASPYVS